MPFSIARQLSPKLIEFTREIQTTTLNNLNEDKLTVEIETCISDLLATSGWFPNWVLPLDPGAIEKDYIIATDIEKGPMIILVSLKNGQVGRVHDHSTWGTLGIIQGCERHVTYDCHGKIDDIFDDSL